MTTLTIPFESAVAWVSGAGLLALVGWLLQEAGWARRARTASRPDDSRLWRCHICTVCYSRPSPEHLTICPQCGSYNS